MKDNNDEDEETNKLLPSSGTSSDHSDDDSGTGRYHSDGEGDDHHVVETMSKKSPYQVASKNEKSSSNSFTGMKVKPWKKVISSIGIILFYAMLFYILLLFNRNNRMSQYKYPTTPNIFPKELLKDGESTNSDNDEQGQKIEAGVYSLSDLQNEMSVVPYWEDVLSTYKVPIKSLYYNDDYFENNHDSTNKLNSEAYAVTNENSDDSNGKKTIVPHLGPCYLPQNQPDMDSIQWTSLIEKNFNRAHPKRNITYPPPENDDKHFDRKRKQDQAILDNYCRPGFIIIGAGKCGTSSLYHYLVGHDRVVPAKQKQIHYFKYFTKRPMSWYLSHFYSAQDFLSSGALMTGEASPGYLPYPDVAHRIQVYMKTKAGNGYNQPVSMPKIITIVRDPLERSYSSYKYNYITPNLEKIKKEVNSAIVRSRKDYHVANGHRNKQRRTMDKKRADMIESIISKNMTDEEIVDEYFFSFEQLVEAEINLLQECLKSGGAGERGAEKEYGSEAWAHALLEKRNTNSTNPDGMMNKLPPLVTLDESCYGEYISTTLPRRQWEELVEMYPKKLINVNNLHLVQSLVGRSLYSLPLEWWYELYPRKDLFLVCNEDLMNYPSETMSEVSEFLGLPKFNFDPVVEKGLYNVGGNEGYDQITDWDADNDESISGPTKTNDNEVPISFDLRERYLSFVKPYNQRLFELTDTICNW